MSERDSVNIFDPLERYVSNPGDLRETLDKSNAIVSGLWTLSVLIGDNEAFWESPSRSPLKITIPKGNDWKPIGNLLQKNDYQLRGNYMAQHGGVLFVRENNDNLSLEFDEKEDNGWRKTGSLQRKAVHSIMGERFGCFMTSKYAVFVCELKPRSDDGGLMERVRKSIVAEYEAQPQGTATKRWEKFENMILSIVELDNRATVPDSFNELLSGNNVFQKLSELTQSNGD